MAAPRHLLLFCFLAATVPTLFGQESPKAHVSTIEQNPDILELSAFGGASFFSAASQGAVSEKLVTGGVAGGRAAYNFSQHFSLEGNYSFSVNNARLAIGGPAFSFGNQLQTFSINPVYNFTRRGSRIRPYVTAGVGPTWFVPTKQARAQFPQVTKSTEFEFSYGGGLKYHLTPHLGFRLDARGVFGRNPSFGLASLPNAHLNGLQATAGLVFYFWQARGVAAPSVTAAVVTPEPKPKPTLQPLNPGELKGGSGPLCQDRVLTLHATTTDPAGRALSYKWKANGAEVGTNDPDLSYKPNNAGDFEFEVEVSDAGDPARSVRLGPKTLVVQEYVPPKISGLTASPNLVTISAEAPVNQTVILAADMASTPCGGNLTYQWAASEGTLTNTAGPSAVFETSSLAFESGAGQSKTITVSVTATDETARSVSLSTAIVVDYPAQYKRLPDVVFAKNSARVNNCGKRILIEQAAPQAGTAFDILLVGHRGKDEVGSVSLDRQRVLAVAAVLTADHQVCGNLDLSQVRPYVAGVEQTSAADPGFCGTSNLPVNAERRGAEVSELDNERRVEVYLMPKGGRVLPPAARHATGISASTVKGLGCPK